MSAKHCYGVQWRKADGETHTQSVEVSEPVQVDDILHVGGESVRVSDRIIYAATDTIYLKCCRISYDMDGTAAPNAEGR